MIKGREGSNVGTCDAAVLDSKLGQD
jgi:hypothetical protein